MENKVLGVRFGVQLANGALIKNGNGSFGWRSVDPAIRAAKKANAYARADGTGKAAVVILHVTVGATLDLPGVV